MRISDWSSDVCSSDLPGSRARRRQRDGRQALMLNDPTFWVAVAFVVFAGLMIWKARQPVLKGLDARAERIRAELDEAQRLREEAQKALAEYKRKQRDAAKEAEDLLASARHEADLLRRQAADDLTQTLARKSTRLNSSH